MDNSQTPQTHSRICPRKEPPEPVSGRGPSEFDFEVRRRQISRIQAMERMGLPKKNAVDDGTYVNDINEVTDGDE
jgi:hypothetical protein